MRIKALAALVVIMLISPTITAHGADTFSFIMRNSSIQPASAQVTQNDSIIFHNVVEQERIIQLNHPTNESLDWNCTAASYNQTSVDDSCMLWFDVLNWTVGQYEIEIHSNGTLWQTVNINLVSDNHTETTPNFTLGTGGSEQNESGDSDTMQTTLMRLSILLYGVAALVWISKKIGKEEEE